MASDISICSSALFKLGRGAIASLTEDTDSARMCNAIYAEARDSLLRNHLWNFATKRSILAAESTSPSFEWSYSHPLPADCLRVIGLDQSLVYTIENNRVLSNQTPLYLSYIYRNTDPNSWDSIFVELLTQKLVAEMAYAVTRSDSKSQTEQAKFLQLLKAARSTDALEAPQNQIQDFPMINARFGSPAPLGW